MKQNKTFSSALTRLALTVFLFIVSINLATAIITDTSVTSSTGNFTSALYSPAVYQNNSLVCTVNANAPFTGTVNLTQGLVAYQNWSDAAAIKIVPTDTYGYGRIAFYPEGNYSRATGSLNGTPLAEGDVLINVHKEKPNGEVHKHISLYTTNSTNSLTKRWDVDYQTDWANFTIQNMNLVMDENTYIKPVESGVTTNYLRISDGRTNAGKGIAILTKNASGSDIERMVFNSYQNTPNIEINNATLDLNSNVISDPIILRGIVQDDQVFSLGTDSDARFFFRAAINALRLTNASGTADGFAIADFKTDGTKAVKLWNLSSAGAGKGVCVRSDGYLGTCADALNASGQCTCS